ALADQVVEAELVGQEELGVGHGPLDAGALEDGGQDDPPAVALHVENRVADRHRDLVAQLRRALRVAVDQDVGHGRARSPPGTVPTAATTSAGSEIPA